uniref:Uncharacterized protein n=1 Tax=Ditylenchus dipsaci TaxID=166011 RepID=A0A915CQ99_9BILA
MSLVESGKEASSSASSDSVKVPSDGESLAQSILKMEMNLSKEIKENLAVGNDKMMSEFLKVQKNFDDMFDRMDHQEEAIEKIRLQFIQLNARFEKFERDQENLNKRISGLVAVSNGRTRAPLNSNMVRPQQSNHQSQQLHHRNRTFVSKFVKADLPEEKHSSAQMIRSLDTAYGICFQEHCQFLWVRLSDSKSELQLKEGACIKIAENIARTDALKSTLEPHVEAVVETPTITESQASIDPLISSVPDMRVFFEQKILSADSKVSVSPEKEKPIPTPATVSPPSTMSADVAEALAKMTAASKSPAMSSSPAAKPSTAAGGLSGGFGGGRRGKPANVTPAAQKLNVESPKVSLGTPVLATEVVVGEIVSRPLTMDEMGVLNKVFQKKDSPKPGAFFGKGGGGGGAMIPAAALERRSPANQFSSSPSFSSPRTLRSWSFIWKQLEEAATAEKVWTLEDVH